MSNSIKSMNNRITEWQISQIKLVGKVAQYNLNHVQSVLESSMGLYAAVQQDSFDAFTAEEK